VPLAWMTASGKLTPSMLDASSLITVLIVIEVAPVTPVMPTFWNVLLTGHSVVMLGAAAVQTGGVFWQASPTPLSSLSSCPGFAVFGQLSHASPTPS